jgi:regulator of replication initiation timing
MPAKLLHELIQETEKLVEEKLNQVRQLEQQIQQFQQAFQHAIKEHNDLTVRLNTLKEIDTKLAMEKSESVEHDQKKAAK